jgi:hypothetical protein
MAQSKTVSEFATREALSAAIKLYSTDKTAALEKHGAIGEWRFPAVDVLDRLFSHEIDPQAPLESLGDEIKDWDVGHVTSMRGMFSGLECFRGRGLGAWDVSSVVDASNMFSGCSNLDADLSAWRPRVLQNAFGMFSQCVLFEADLSQWPTSRLVDIADMFAGCVAFDCDTSGWDLSRVKNMIGTFQGSAFSGKGADKWNLAKVVNLANAFRQCSKFDADLTGWKLPKIDAGNWDCGNVCLSGTFVGSGFTWRMPMWMTSLLCPSDMSNWREHEIQKRHKEELDGTAAAARIQEDIARSAKAKALSDKEELYLTYEVSHSREKATHATGTLLTDPASAECISMLLKCALHESEAQGDESEWMKSWTVQQVVQRAEESLTADEWGFGLTGLEGDARAFPPFTVDFEIVCDKGNGIQVQRLKIARGVIAEWWAKAENRCAREWIVGGEPVRSSYAPPSDTRLRARTDEERKRALESVVGSASNITQADVDKILKPKRQKYTEKPHDDEDEDD